MRAFLRHKTKDTRQSHWQPDTEHRSLKRGFTLTEVLLVLSLLAVILGGVLPLFLNIITTNKSTELYSKAYKDLDSKIETLRNLNYDSIVNGSFTVADLPAAATPNTISVIDNAGGIPNLKQVTVVINWDFKGNKSIKATTFIARGGIK